MNKEEKRINNKCNFIDNLLLDNGLYKGVSALIEIEEHISNLYDEIDKLQHQLEEKEQQMNIMSEAFDELEHQKQDYTQINILEMKLKEKDKVIDEAIKLANDILVSGWDYVEKDNICIKLLEILERGKNVNSK